MRVHLSFAALCMILILAVPSRAQVGTMQWKFKSRADVVPTLKKTRGNLRNTYNVLICSARQGYINTALGFYEKAVLGREFDATAQDSAAFAFAHALADGFIPWNWKKDRDYSSYKGSSKATAAFFRERALKNGSRLPEVLVMQAYVERFGFKEGRKRGFELASKAIRLAPDWADAHYWFAESAQYYGLALQDDVWPTLKKPSSKVMMVGLGKVGMRSCDKAEKLDPGIQSHLYMGRIILSELIADKTAAKMIPIYANAHLRASPEYATWYQKKQGKTTKDFLDTYEAIAQKIERTASS